MLELALTGDPITAEEALAAGLVNAVVPADDVLAAANRLAERISANAPLAVQASRRVLTQAFDSTEEELYRLSGQAIASLVDTDDYAEGPRAFIEKRSPVWTGR